MPSYVVRDTITKQTSNKIIGKNIGLYLYTDNNYLYDIGPICSIYPMKNSKDKQVLIFYLDDDKMNWVLYIYKQIEVPKNMDSNSYNLIVESKISEGNVPVKITLDKQ